MKKLGTLAVLALTLAGCSAADPPATDTEVASVVARYETDWRDAADSAMECRGFYLDADRDLIAGLEALTCLTRQGTTTITAATAARDLRALTIPESMTGPVDEMLRRLDAVATVDLDVCGDAPDMTDPACSAAVTKLDFALGRLAGTLDAWRPYLS